MPGSVRSPVSVRAVLWPVAVVLAIVRSSTLCFAMTIEGAYVQVMTNLDVLVVGAGVSGLTTAVCLAEAGQRVRIRTAAPPAETTSAVAGALWVPYLVEAGGRVWEWCEVTLEELRGLVGTAGSGVRMVRGAEGWREPVDPPEWRGLLDDFRLCGPEDLPA